MRAGSPNVVVFTSVITGIENGRPCVMSEGEVEFVKVDALKRILRNVNVIVKVVDIGGSFDSA